jgi:class 3 adenylate cyclase/tetratricopeptide (TPR) repeat protein
MELLADRDPEEARELLDPVLERMMQAVHRYEGTVNQVMGDGIMALFGAPIAHEDHAVRACYAALRMQESVKAYAEEVRRSHAVAVRIREGLNSGEVVVRAIRSDLHMDYTAVGQTTHLAARMEQLATPGTVLITADTLRLAEGQVTVKRRGPLAVKGLETPIEAFELIGAAPRRSRLHAAAAHGLTRFVGRDVEMQRLEQALRRAVEGHGQVVAIVGEPGVGKSRLVWEIVHSPRRPDWLVLQAGSVSYGAATPYLPVIDLLKRYFNIEERDEPPAVLEKMAARLSRLDRALAGHLSAFLALLDLPTGDARWEVLDPTQRRRRTLDAVTQLLLRESRRQPVLVVLEDLHWVDSETQALLDSLVESLPEARLVLLVDYRPEYRHAWVDRRDYSELRLDALPPENAEELLGTLLGSDADLEPLKRVLIARTERNPFFLEESVRALAETGTLQGGRGDYRLARPLPTIQVPPTVQAVLAARIDRLSPRDKAVLQTASVVGPDVPLGLLHELVELTEDELNAAIERLRAGEFLREGKIFPEPEYAFKHALTHDVTYGSLLHDHRRMLHGRIVEIIERVHADRVVEQVERLAHHAVRGEVWSKAIGYLRQAAEKAAARSAHRAAVRSYEEALDALARIPATAATTAEAIDLRFAIRNGLFAVGEHGRIRTCIEEAQRLALGSGDEGRLAWASVYMSNYFWREGDPAQAIVLGQHALTVAGQRQDPALRITASLRLGQAHHARGDYRRAVECLAAGLAGLEGRLDRALFGLAGLPAVFCRAFLVWSLAELGDFPAGIRHADQAIEIADAADQTYSRAIARFTLGFLHLVRGEPDRAITVLERGLAIQESGEILALRAMFLAALGHARTLAGRPDEALPLLEQSVESSAFSLSPQHPFPLLFFAEACLRADRIERSEEAARRCLQFCRGRSEVGAEAWTLRLLGEIGRRRQPLEAPRAEAHYRQAMALAAERGMRPLVAHCHLGLGELERRARRRPEEPPGHLTAAISIYRDLGMAAWLEKAETLARPETEQ